MPKILEQLSSREQSIAAAAYLRGLAVGLSTHRTKTWHRRVRGSLITESSIFGTVDNFLWDGRGNNPLIIYEMQELADTLGLRDPHHEACVKVEGGLNPLNRKKSNA